LLKDTLITEAERSKTLICISTSVCVSAFEGTSFHWTVTRTLPDSELIETRWNVHWHCLL